MAGGGGGGQLLSHGHTKICKFAFFERDCVAASNLNVFLSHLLRLLNVTVSFHLSYLFVFQASLNFR